VLDTHITDHFTLDECKCPCCDHIRVTPGFYAHMELLEAMRQELGFPIIINSGYRCPVHNASVGGAARSWHLLFATDVRPSCVAYAGMSIETRLRAMYRVALVQEWGGIGYYNTFLHLDMRPEPARWRE